MLTLLALILFCQQITHAAVATFSIENSGAQGTVTINDREIIIYLNISQVNTSLLPSTECFANGTRYHIHSKWAYSDNKDRIGATNCGATYTGYHWDPWTACSSSTSDKHCLVYPSTSVYKCVNSSSAYTDTNEYTCNSSVYAENPFACEVGDFDGKYGRLYLTDDNVLFSRTDASFWEVKSSDVHNKAIVFHCGTSNKRALCAPFDASDDLSSNLISQTSNSMMAVFEGLDDSYISLGNDGTYEVSVDLSNVMSDLTCSNVSYRIYNSWLGEDTSYVGNSDCSEIVGKVYDPTVSCLNNSDSSFCHSGIICNDTSYYYNCSNTNDRYYCSPSDLSGKYGNLETDFSESSFWKTGNDELMIPLNLVTDKSIVLECSDYSTKIACAKLSSVIVASSGASHHNLRSKSKKSDLKPILKSKSIKPTRNISLIVLFVLIGVFFIFTGYICFKNKRLAQMFQGNAEETTPLISTSPFTVV